MKRALLLILPLLPAVAGCAAKVTHPTKSTAEMQADIDLCTRAANKKYWMDPVAALYNAYDCLEARGYQRGDSRMAAKVERAVAMPVGAKPADAGAAAAKVPGTAPPAKGAAPQPCRVPCSKPKG